MRGPWRVLRGLPRELWVLAGATFVNRVGTMALPFLVLFVTEARGLTVPQAGFVMATYGLGGVLVAPLAGRLSDRVGALRLMRFSLITGGLALLAFPLLRGLWAILGGTLGWSLLSEAFRPASMAAVSEVVPAAQRRTAFAVNRLAINLGMSVGPAVGGFLATVSFAAIFVVDGVTTLAAAVVLMSFAPPRTAAARADHSRTIAPEPERLPGRAWNLGLVLLGTLLAVTVFAQDVGPLPVFLVSGLGHSPAFFGILFTLNTLLVIALEIPLNAMMGGWRYRYSLALGALLLGLGFGALAFARTATEIAATVVVWTFGEMILFPASAAYVAELAPPGRLGSYMGAYTMMFAVAFMIGPPLGTLALSDLGAVTLWTATFVVGAVAAALLLAVRDAPATVPAARTSVE